MPNTSSLQGNANLNHSEQPHIPVTNDMPSFAEDVEELKLLCTAAGLVKLYHHFGKQLDSFLKL